MENDNKNPADDIKKEQREDNIETECEHICSSCGAKNKNRSNLIMHRSHSANCIDDYKKRQTEGI